ncbi:MAG: hypothetical protein AAGF66_04710 [Cyanobacteria bacterium P01_H01_bin.119]
MGYDATLQSISEQFKAIARTGDIAALVSTLDDARQQLSDAKVTMAYWYAYQDLNYQQDYDAADWLLIIVKNLRQLTSLDAQDLPKAA